MTTLRQFLPSTFADVCFGRCEAALLFARMRSGHPAWREDGVRVARTRRARLSPHLVARGTRGGAL
jgi:hypothetical protein